MKEPFVMYGEEHDGRTIRLSAVSTRLQRALRAAKEYARYTPDARIFVAREHNGRPTERHYVTRGSTNAS